MPEAVVYLKQCKLGHSDICIEKKVDVTAMAVISFIYIYLFPMNRVFHQR